MLSRLFDLPGPDLGLPTPKLFCFVELVGVMFELNPLLSWCLIWCSLLFSRAFASRLVQLLTRYHIDASQ